MYLKLFLILALSAVTLTDNPPPQSTQTRIPAKSEAKQGGGTPAPSSDTTPAEPDSGGKKGGKKGRGGGGGKCFHGSNIVVTDKGKMTMTELFMNKDTKVLTKGADGKLEYSSVYYWIHAKPDVKTEYIIYTTESGHSLSITGKHLIYQTDCNGNSETVLADKVNVGKCLYVSENGEMIESKVISKLKEDMMGVYAPITNNGNIVVNGVLASCFSDVENETIQRIIYSYMNYARSCLKYLLPSSFIDLLYSNQSDAMVHVPEVLLSFLNLSKGFFK